MFCHSILLITVTALFEEIKNKYLQHVLSQSTLPTFTFIMVIMLQGCLLFQKIEFIIMVSTVGAAEGFLHPPPATASFHCRQIIVHAAPYAEN